MRKVGSCAPQQDSGRGSVLLKKSRQNWGSGKCLHVVSLSWLPLVFSGFQYKQCIIQLNKLGLSKASSFSILKTYQLKHGCYMWYALKPVTIDADTLAELSNKVCGLVTSFLQSPWKPYCTSQCWETSLFSRSASHMERLGFLSLWINLENTESSCHFIPMHIKQSEGLSQTEKT